MSAAELLTEEAPLKRHRFTVEEYYAMGDRGIIPSECRTELIDGGVLDFPSMGQKCSASIASLIYLLIALDRHEYYVTGSHAARLDDHTAPEPDVMILRARADQYRSGPPAVSDILLVVEVSDATLRFDREVKARLYAKAGIPEYWIVNLVENRIEVHRQPSAEVYAERVVVGPGESFGPLCAPSLRLQYEQVFPALTPNA